MFSSHFFHHFLSLSLFFVFYPCGIAHTYCVQYGFSVPSFPNVSARDSPQEQDEEQRVRDGRAGQLRPETDAGERQALQRSSLDHLQAGAEAPAHSAGGFRAKGLFLPLRRIRQTVESSIENQPCARESSNPLLTVQMKRKELLQRDDDDEDSMMSSSTSDTNSIKRKRSVRLCSDCPLL